MTTDELEKHHIEIGLNVGARLEIIAAHARKLEEDMARLRALGVVYVPPSDWSCAKNGGRPELSDCEEVDLASA